MRTDGTSLCTRTNQPHFEDMPKSSTRRVLLFQPCRVDELVVCMEPSIRQRGISSQSASKCQPTAVYHKLNRVEAQVSAAIVQETAQTDGQPN